MKKTKVQKLIKVGNSYALTIDKKFVDSFVKETPPTYQVTYSTEPLAITISPTTPTNSKSNPASIDQKSKELASKISPELEQWTKDFLKENKQALTELANL